MVRDTARPNQIWMSSPCLHHYYYHYCCIWADSNLELQRQLMHILLKLLWISLSFWQAVSFLKAAKDHVFAGLTRLLLAANHCFPFPLSHATINWTLCINKERMWFWPDQKQIKRNSDIIDVACFIFPGVTGELLTTKNFDMWAGGNMKSVIFMSFLCVFLKWTWKYEAVNHLIYDCLQMFLTCWSFSDLFTKERLFLLHRLMIQLQSKSSTCAWRHLKVKYRLHRLTSWKEWMAYLAGKSFKMSKQSTAIIPSSLWTNSWCLFGHRLFPSQPSSTVTQLSYRNLLSDGSVHSKRH